MQVLWGLLVQAAELVWGLLGRSGLLLGFRLLGFWLLGLDFLGSHGDDVKSLLDEQRSQKVQTGWEGAAQGRLSVKAFISFDPREERLA